MLYLCAYLGICIYSTADRLGLFNCMSVARNLPKSVFLCTKQFIFSSSNNETFGRQKNKYLMGHNLHQKGINPCSIHNRYVHIDVF